MTKSVADVSKVNLVQNGNFIDGLKFWTGQGVGEADIRVENGHLFYQKKDNDFSALYQDVNIPSSGVYSVEIAANNHNMSDTQVVVLPFSNGKFGDWHVISYIKLPPVDGWQQVSKLINIGKDVTKVRIAIHSNKKGTFFSAISLSKSFSHETQNIPTVVGSPTLDGNIDESFWKNALVLSGFRVLGEPNTLAKVNTKVFLASSNDYLYVAYEVDEPNMDKLTLVKKNIVGLYAGDDVELFISIDREQYYQFLANAGGFKGASQKLTKTQRLRTIWYDEPEDANEFSGKWQVAAKKMSKKYIVEMAIKLNDIFGSRPVTNPVLYMNFCRHRTIDDLGQVYTNWAGLAGKTLHTPQNFPEFKLSWKNSGTSVNTHNVVSEITPLISITEPLTVPSMLIVGKPIKMIFNKGSLMLPELLNINDEVFPVDNGVKKFISTGAAGIKNGGTVTIDIAEWNDKLVPPLSQEEKIRCASPEAFVLTTAPGIIKINAKTHDGVLRALATLALLGSQAKSFKFRALPCFVMVDAPWFKVRGWDAGGIREPDTLKKMVDLYFLLRLNYLQFQVGTYDQYTAFPFESHPNIGRSKFTKKDFSDLADYAKARGITLLPMFYSWSRAGFIFNKPEYVKLSSTGRPETVKNPMGAHNRNGNAFNPDTEALIFDLYDELIDTMKLTNICLGLDEVHFSTVVDQDAPYSKGKTTLDWFKAVITKSRGHLAPKKVRMWIYADELSPYHNGPCNDINDANKDMAKLGALPKDVVMMPWHYEIPNTGRYDAVTFFRQAGFPVVGVPCWYRINNVPTFIHDLRSFKGDGVIGSTWGNPLPSDATAELFSAISMLAYLAWSPENCELAEFPFVPSVLYQYIAFRYGHELPYAEKSVALTLPENTVATPIETLKNEIGFPQNMKFYFLKKTFTTWRGVVIMPFSINDEIATIAVHGGANETVCFPISKKVNRFTFLHAVNKMYDYECREIRKYAKATAGIYELTYEDGTKAELSLKLRMEVNEWNDGILAKKCEPGIYGSLERKLHINIPVYTWDNPHPDKTVKSLAIRSGNSKNINLYLLGLSQE